MQCLMCSNEIPLDNEVLLFNDKPICMKCESLAKETITVFELSPELGDGQQVFVEKAIGNVLSAVKQFCEHALSGEIEPGEFCKIKIGKMTRAEFECLPEA